MTKRLLIGLVFVLLQSASTRTSSFEARTVALDRARVLTAWFHERNFDRLYGAFLDLYRAFMNRAQLRAFRQEVENQIGTEVSVEDETASRRGGLLVYTRTATFGKFPGTVDVT